MPVSFLLRDMSKERRAGQSFDWMGRTGVVRARDFAFIGLRDVEESEQKMMENLSPDLLVFRTTDVKKMGARDVIMRVLERLCRDGRERMPFLHVSFDIDVLDPRIAGSTGTAVASGLSPDDAYIMADHVSATGRLRVMDLVEVNPLIGTEVMQKRTASVAAEVIASFLRRRQHAQDF